MHNLKDTTEVKICKTVAMCGLCLREKDSTRRSCEYDLVVSALFDKAARPTYLDCWLASFPENLNLEGLLHFPYLHKHNRKTYSLFLQNLPQLKTQNVNMEMYFI